MKEKRKGISIQIFIIVIIMFLILGLVGGIFLSKEYLNIEDKTTTEKTTNETTKVVSNEKLTETEIQKYITFIPYYKLTPSDNIKDSYSGEEINIENINQALLLYMSIQKTKAETDSNELPKVDGGLCGINVEPCQASEYYNKDKVNEILLQQYNTNTITIGPDNISYPGGIITIINDYYTVFFGSGSFEVKKMNKIINAYKTQKEIIIEEKAVFYNDAYQKTTFIYKNSLDASKLENSIAKKENNIHTLDETYVKEYLDENINQFNIFKHTFKQNESGEYYWYSSKLVEK